MEVKGIIYQLIDYSSDTEIYKIGITKKEVEKRIKQLQTGSSKEIVLLRKYKSYYYKEIEQQLHRKYNNYKITEHKGGQEWFELPDKVAINFIKDCEEIENNIKFLKENNTLTF